MGRGSPSARGGAAALRRCRCGSGLPDRLYAGSPALCPVPGGLWEEGGDWASESETDSWYAMQLAKKRTIVIGPKVSKYAPDENGKLMRTGEEYDKNTPFEELDKFDAVSLMPDQGHFVDDEGMACTVTEKPVARTPEYQALLEGADAERKETANPLDDDRDKDDDE